MLLRQLLELCTTIAGVPRLISHVMTLLPGHLSSLRRGSCYSSCVSRTSLPSWCYTGHSHCWKLSPYSALGYFLFIFHNKVLSPPVFLLPDPVQLFCPVT